MRTRDHHAICSKSGFGADLGNGRKSRSSARRRMGSQHGDPNLGRGFALQSMFSKCESIFPNSMHEFDAGDGDRRLAKSLEPKHRAQTQLGFTRSAEVVRKIMDGHRPRVWRSGRYSAQQRHGALHQTCLAHPAGDAAYGLKASEDPVSFRLKLWFGRVFILADHLAEMAQSARCAK